MFPSLRRVANAPFYHAGHLDPGRRTSCSGLSLSAEASKCRDRPSTSTAAARLDRSRGFDRC